MGTTFIVTLPDGSTAKRTTGRVYTHAVVASDRALAWCGSLALAQKQLASFQPYWSAVSIVATAVLEKPARKTSGGR